MSSNTRPAQRQRGQIIIEAVIGLALVSMVLVVLVQLASRSVRVQVSNRLGEQSQRLTQESMEALRQIRDGFGVIKADGTDYTWDWENPDDIWVDENTSPGCTPDCLTYFRLYYDAGNTRWTLEKQPSNDPTADSYRLDWINQGESFGYAGLGGFPSGADDSPYYRQIAIEDRPGSDPTDPKRSKTVITTISWFEGERLRQSRVVSILSLW